MPQVFYGNFDFEHELADAGYNRTGQLERLNAELIAHLLALAADGDLLFCSDVGFEEFLADAQAAGFPSVRPIDSGHRGVFDARLVPWGCSNQAVDFAISRGWSCETPPVTSVVRANSRHFSFELEQRRRAAIPGAAEVDSLEAVESAIIDAADVLKSRAAEFN